MTITNKTVEEITLATYEIEIAGDRYVYIEYLNAKGNLLDAVLRDTHGNDMGDAGLLEDVQNEIGKLESAENVTLTPK